MIDADIHPTPNEGELDGFLPRRVCQYIDRFGTRYFPGDYPRLSPAAARSDAWPPGGFPGSDLGFLQEQLLDRWQIDVGVLNPIPIFGTLSMNRDVAAAMATAFNEWIVAEWLDRDPRLLASISVAVEEPDLASAEIERCAHDTRFAQVLLWMRSREPLGRRRYWPIYETAVRHGLPVAMHFGGRAGNPATPVGAPSFYIEEHTWAANAFQEQVASWIFEGVFDRFPALRIVLVEGGFAWLLPLMWRLDRAWQRYREEVPHLVRPPSEIIREHFWVTTQPMEEPPRDELLLDLLSRLDMSDRLLFATDYPHWDFDPPDRTLPRAIDARTRSAILHDNAASLYGQAAHAPPRPTAHV